MDQGTHEAPLVQWTSQALLDVAAERRRQLEVEGWTPEHDDEHQFGELAAAAASYATHARARAWLISDFKDGEARYQNDRVENDWPWDENWWKPKTPRRDLVRAAALLLAEIERMDRKAAREQQAG